MLDHLSDMWLNEGFATWSEWIWTERHGGQTAHQRFEQLYAVPEASRGGQDLWFPAPDALPGPADLFGTPVYDRGALTLQALREKVGDRVFFGVLKAWYLLHRNATAGTADFIRLAELASHQDLDPFFQTWLYTTGKPTTW